jgi:hypothetical protein
MDMPSTKCPDFRPCKMTVVKSFSTSITKGFSIATGRSTSFGRSLSDAEDRAYTNSYTRSMGRTLEESFTKGKTATDERSIAETITDSIGKTMEIQTGKSETSTNEASKTLTFSIDETASGIIF